MNLPSKTEVLVIGGGLIGSSVAYHLATRGVQVLVVDRNDLAMDASGACDGMVFLQTKKPGIHLEIALESAERIRKLAATSPVDFEYRNSGGMMVIEDENDLEDGIICSTTTKERPRSGTDRTGGSDCPGTALKF
jgi:glycine/D-amino acid oxidase-like deaminating enzyme